jgi:methyl-accepting chemotaxis protein
MKNWLPLTIGRRIALSFAAVVFITSAVSLSTLLRTRAISADVDTINVDYLPGTIAILEIRNEALRNQSLLTRRLLTRDATDVATLDEALRTTRTDQTRRFHEYDITIHLDDDRANFRELERGHEQVTAIQDAILALASAGKSAEAAARFEQQMIPAFAKFDLTCVQMVKWNRDHATELAAAIQDRIATTNRLLLAGIVGALAAAVTLGALATLQTSRAVRNVANSLRDTASQVAAAAQQVAAASETLAQGTSEHAAQLQESSASLLEIDSRTKHNADSAAKAHALADHARRATGEGTERVNQMVSAMDAIKSSSDNIAKIIKTIDEIAFQTNILALNAAVEAARAGEAGAGFAVVAEEVRALAQRAAHAARETAEKIDDSIRKSADGAEISAKVSAGLGEIASKTREVNEIVAQIATASNEQTGAIASVSTAVRHMDQITQAGAASAEETASAAEELNAQADTLVANVEDLMRLVEAPRRSAPDQPSRPAGSSPTRTAALPVARSTRRPTSIAVS